PTTVGPGCRGAQVGRVAVVTNQADVEVGAASERRALVEATDEPTAGIAGRRDLGNDVPLLRRVAGGYVGGHVQGRIEVARPTGILGVANDLQGGEVGCGLGPRRLGHDHAATGNDARDARAVVVRELE